MISQLEQRIEELEAEVLLLQTRLTVRMPRASTRTRGRSLDTTEAGVIAETASVPTYHMTSSSVLCPKYLGLTEMTRPTEKPIKTGLNNSNR